MADLYDITAQQEALDLGGPDGTQRVVVVTFTTKPSGVTGTVRIPLARYSPAEVDKAVREYADKIEQVHQL